MKKLNKLLLIVGMIVSSFTSAGITTSAEDTILKQEKDIEINIEQKLINDSQQVQVELTVEHDSDTVIKKIEILEVDKNFEFDVATFVLSENGIYTVEVEYEKSNEVKNETKILEVNGIVRYEESEYQSFTFEDAVDIPDKPLVESGNFQIERTKIIYETLAEAIAASQNNDTIQALNDYITRPEDTIAALTIPVSKNLKLTSEVGVYTITRGRIGHLITVNGGLILENIVIDGDKVTYPANSGSLIIVKTGATAVLTMNEGSVLRNNYNFYSLGSSGAGAAVSVMNNSNFTMNEGAKIENNQGYHGAGGVYINGLAKFYMIGGEISGNIGSGVYVSSSTTFTMTGGKISDNTQGGVLSNQGAIIMSGGEISGNKKTGTGAGVVVGNKNGSFTMTGGEVSGNVATSHGGGVYVYGTATINVGGTAKITNNFKGTEINNVYLTTNHFINLTSPLTIGAKIGVANPIIKNTQFGNSVDRHNVSDNDLYFENDVNTTLTSAYNGATSEIIWIEAPVINNEITLTTSSTNGTITNWALKGDVTRDGVVNQDDADAIAKHLSGAAPITNPGILQVGDVDGDGRLTGNDGNWIARVTTGAVTVPQPLFTMKVVNTPNTGYETMGVTINGVVYTIPAKGNNMVIGDYTITVDNNGVVTVEGIIQEYANEVAFENALISPVINPTPSTPVPPTPEVGRTCQDDGYSNDYYWNGTACIIDAVPPPAANQNLPTNQNKPSQPTEEPKVEEEKIITSVIDAVTEIPKVDENIETVKPEETPLVKGGGWSLINLIIMISSMTLAIHLLIMKKRKEELEDDIILYYQKNKLFIILGTLCTVLLIVVFFLTQNLSLPMILVDKYTWIMIVIFILNLLIYLFANQWREVKN